MDTFNTWRNLPANYQTLWFNLHFQQTGLAGAGDFFRLRDAGTTQFGLGLNGSNQISVNAGGAALAVSASNVWAVGAWYFIQGRVSIANAGGRIEIWLQGQKVIDFTGDTQNTANAYVNQWQMTRNNNLTIQTNLILYDETGDAPTTRTPETRIYADLPTGAGDTTGWTPLSGSNWQMVDEQPNDGDTSYNAAAAATTDDLYGYPGATVPGGSIVYAVAAEMDCRKDDAGTNDLDTLVRTGGTTYAHGSTFALTASYQRYRTIWTQNPNTVAAWTPAEANAAQVGVRRKA
jgi:hypothetical protein